MSQYDEYSTPSQAEGERLDEDMDEREKRQRHPQTTRTTPSQAEGERVAEDDGKQGSGA
ncbi:MULTISPECIES: hypothetical protein [unclassified Streptomyces]|uniref:hypothetical protein n=1 Tax=unclassified Streptomyces TaxID=2593676 RepID=UPI00226DCDC3|nr:MULTISPECIES: hypothetical protein [unclassified Streptomyces]MCY0920135.1 hypothetical protein [Streptomyces sp. H27-G5]MCY0959846.1 hypothetical protein [Streptomyces sp. H27-H5]